MHRLTPLQSVFRSGAGLAFGLMLPSLLACGGSGGSVAQSPAPPVTTSVPQVVDCVPGASGCSLVQIAGDPPYTPPGGQPSPFSGTADPTLRKDPASSALWLAYSWPHYLSTSPLTPAVEVHLAKSLDGGSTWNAVKVLFPADAGISPTTGQSGVTFHEVCNLLPVQESGGVTWYSANLDYFAVGSNPDGRSFRIRVAKAATPEELSTAPGVSLGAAGTDAAWGADQNLSALSTDLSDVGNFNEPALCYENGRLYLVVVSFHYNQGQPALDRDKIHVFSTIPSGAPATWTWTYRGVLAGNAEALELGGQRLTQVDIVRGLDGKLLMVATPDDWNSTLSDYNHKGCVVAEIASLSTPALARGTNGKLKVRARVTASDANALGSAASTYDPDSSTGLLFTRRNKTPTSFTIEFWRTGLRF